MSATTLVETIDILVTGLPEAGKSRFMQTLSPRLIKKQGWHYVHLAVDETLRMRFLEPPAQRHFDYLELRHVIETSSAHGYVILCDSTHPALFSRVVGLLQTVRAFHEDAPCVIVANKQDHPHAWSSEDIRHCMHLPQSIPVVPCVASQLDLVRDAVILLLYQIFEA
jgi:signal recognition particle receptor subunit beta